MEKLTPLPQDDLERAADVLANFRTHWEACGSDVEAQHRLIKLIVERVYVRDEQVVAMTLRSDYHVVLGHNMNGSTEMEVDPYVYMDGSDGRRSLLCTILLYSLPCTLNGRASSFTSSHPYHRFQPPYRRSLFGAAVFRKRMTFSALTTVFQL